MGHATVAIISPTLIIRDSTAAVPRKFCVINYSPAAWQRVLRNSEMRCLRARSVSCHLLAPHLFLVSFTPRTNDHERDHSPLLLRDVLRRRSVQKILHRTIIGKPLCPRFSIRIAEPSVRVIGDRFDDPANKNALPGFPASVGILGETARGRLFPAVIYDFVVFDVSLPADN